MQENIIRDHQKDSIKIKKTLLGSEKGWELTVDAIPDLVAVLDTDHRVVKVNKAMARKLNTLPNDCIGTKCYQVVHHTETPPKNCPHAKLLEDGLEHTSEVDEKNLGGSFVVTASPIKDDDGNLLGSVHIAHDITTHIKVEETLKKRTEELTRSNVGLEQLAYVASHDLREPLRMISSFLQLLEQRYKDQLDQDANEFIGFAVDGAKRLDMMINDLLEYAHVTHKEIDLNPIILENVLEASLINLLVQTEESNSIITYDPLPIVNGDEKLLVQLFQNLIGNAIKYRSQETPKIHISAKKEKNQHIISVKDNGIGIHPKQKERIFKIFQRLHGNDEYPGTGIGLAIAQNIVHQHKGQISVESELCKGTTFYFTIPIQD